MSRTAARRGAVLLDGVLLLAAVAAVYGQCLGFGFVDWDDGIYVTANPEVRGGLTAGGVAWAFTAGYAQNWHPLTWLSHMLDVELFGMAPAGHHATSVVLHAVNALLLLGVGRALGMPRAAAWLVAALFAVHPQQVESVAWIAERKNVLSTTFWLLTLVAYLAWVRQPPAAGRRRQAAVIGCLVLGLMCKPMLVTAPLTLLLVDGWPLRRWPGVPLRRLLAEKLPLLALAAAAAALTYAVQRAGGAVAAGALLPWDARAANAVVSVARYLGHTVWPAELCAYYPHPALAGSGHGAGSVAAAAALLAVITVVSSRRAALAAAWLWFVVTLVPVLGLVQVGGQAMADRYAYVPSIGLFVIVAWCAGRLAAGGVRRRRAVAAAAAATLLALGVVAFGQARTWRDSEALAARILAVDPDAAMGHFLLGNVRRGAGDPAAAAAHYERAAARQPGWVEAIVNLGAAHDDLGRLADAEADYRRALDLEPRHVVARANLAGLLARTGRQPAAIAEFERAIADASAAERAARNLDYKLAGLLLGAGQRDRARHHLQEAVRRRPDLDAARALLRRLGQ